MTWLLISLCALAWACWKLFRGFFIKSQLDSIPGPPAKSFWTGIYLQLFHPTAWDFHREIARKCRKLGIIFKSFTVNDGGSGLKRRERYQDQGSIWGKLHLSNSFGILNNFTDIQQTQLYIFDPKALHQIFVKDHHIYDEMESFTLLCQIILGPGLFGTHGDQHRKQRKMLKPVFSTNHMREMIPTFYGVANKLRSALKKRISNGPQEIEILSWMTRTALEVVGQSGLGYSFDSFTEDHAPHPYAKSAKQIMHFLFKFIVLQRYFLVPLSKIGTARFRRAVVGLLPWKDLHEFRDIVDVMHQTSITILDEKKKALAAGDEAFRTQIGQGNDVMSILLRANMDAEERDRLSEEELIGQINTLTFAAMDTISGVMGRILSVLAMHQDAQDKLRQEVVNARNEHGELTYDQLMSLPYLDAVCRETLRLYPAGTTVVRVACEDAVLGISQPIKSVDGQDLVDLHIPKGTKVIVSILSANCNPEIWGPDSYEWKPERWHTLPESVLGAHLPGVYSHLMTFLAGGRSCIGFKFAELEMKVVISLLIESFRFRPSDKNVVWHMHGVVRPVVPELSESTSQLPLVVELLK